MCINGLVLALALGSFLIGEQHETGSSGHQTVQARRGA
jgi:hypothetical protein